MTTVMVVIDSDIGPWYRGVRVGTKEPFKVCRACKKHAGRRQTDLPLLGVAAIARTAAFDLAALDSPKHERDLSVGHPIRCRVAITVGVRPTNAQRPSAFEAIK
jgi:hypothetical protein